VRSQPKAFLLLFLTTAALAVAVGGCGGEDKNPADDVEDPTPDLEIFHLGADAHPYAGPAPLKIQFYARPFHATGDVRYRWDFDDGTTSTERNPTHTFPKASTYDVAVDARDETENGHVDLIVGAWPPKVWERGVEGMNKQQILRIQRAQQRRTQERKREVRQRLRRQHEAASESS
jgi:hypothetical protein